MAPAAIRMPINASSSTSVKGGNVFDGGRPEARGNLLIRSLLKASHTLLPFQFVSRNMMSQISGLIIDLNKSRGVNRLRFAASPLFWRRMLRDLVWSLGNGLLLHSILSLAIQILLTFWGTGSFSTLSSESYSSSCSMIISCSMSESSGVPVSPFATGI